MTMTSFKGKTSDVRVRENSIRTVLPHLGTAEGADIERIVDVLVQASEPEAIYMFGSQARGTPSRDSDVDLFVVVRDAGEFPHHLAQEAYRLIGHHLVPLDIVFTSRAEFDWRSGVPTSLPGTIVQEGKLLYGAVSLPIALELGLPVLTVPGRRTAVVRARVPETPIYEHGEPCTWEHDIRSNRGSRHLDQEVLAKPQAASVQLRRQAHLGRAFRLLVSERPSTFLAHHGRGDVETSETLPPDLRRGIVNRLPIDWTARP